MHHTYHRIAAALTNEPWLMRRERHVGLVQQFRAAVQAKGQLLKPPQIERDPEGLKLQQRADMDCLSNIEIENGIALIPVHGILGRHLDLLETLCGGYDLELLNAQCLALMNRADVTTAVFHFNTPGGRAAGVAESAQCIRALAESGKRCVAYCDEACSGGMWLAAACDEIICGQSAAIGSISAMCAILDESKAFEMEGLEMQLFTDGALKGAGVEGTTLSAAQRADIQSRVEHIGGMFKDFIRARRPAVANDTMQGQWFCGDQALQLGLVDSLQPTLAHCLATLM